jgi:hypothetical protein
VSTNIDVEQTDSQPFGLKCVDDPPWLQLEICTGGMMGRPFVDLSYGHGESPATEAGGGDLWNGVRGMSPVPARHRSASADERDDVPAAQATAGDSFRSEQQYPSASQDNASCASAASAGQAAVGRDEIRTPDELMAMAKKMKESAVAVGPGAGSEENMPTWQSELKNAAETGNFDLRKSALGFKWTRELAADKKLATEYKGCLSLAEKKQFRTSWAARKLQEVTVSRNHLKDYQRVNEKFGRYLAYGKIADEYGYNVTPQAALKAATSYCKKCLDIGGKWYFYEPMGEILLFFFLEYRYHQIMAESWSLHEKEFSTGENTTKDGASPEAAATTPEPPGKKPRKAEGKAKAKAQGKKDKPEALEDEVTPAKQLMTLMTQAFKLKARIQKAQSEGKLMKELIAKDPKWAWGQCDLYGGNLDKALDKLNTLQEFDEAVMYSDQKELRSKFGSEYLVVNLTKFNGMADDVEQLEKINNRISIMKKASEA